MLRSILESSRRPSPRLRAQGRIGRWTAPLAWMLAGLSLGAAPPAGVFIDQRPLAAIYREGWIDLNKSGSKDPYEDPTLDVEARITDLLARMTLEEKTAQMATLYGFGRVLKDELPTAAWETSLWKDGIGNIDEQINGNTGTDKNLPDPKYDDPWPEHVRALNEIQRWFVERTRLGIPVDFTNEGIRGLLHTKATSFPAQLAVASSWDRALVREIGRVTGREARALGYTNVYSPVLDLARDPRWGRTIESYGEDPFLVSEFGFEQVRGIQEARVVSTLKHFGVYSVPQGGRDGDARTDPHATWSEVQTVLLAPFRRAVRDGHAMGVMASYNDYDGVPVIASRQFLTDILRGEFGFKGYVVSDSGAVEFVHQKHRVAPTPSDGIWKSIQAGLNVRTNFTPPEAYVQPLRELVKSGRLPMATVDARVRDILRVKYWTGSFDAPYGLEPEATHAIVRSAPSLKLAERAGREAIILLKNEGNLLPLSRRTNKVLVAGPLADDQRAWWCRYGPQRLEFVTPLAGIRAKLGTRAEVRYVKGVEARDANWPESDIYREGVPADVRAGIDAAVKAAAGVDVILLVVGEPEELSRESRSRISLELPGYQEDLLRALHATGVPLVVIVSSGRPQSINFAAKHVRAIVNLWYLGENGGSALADVLFGDYNPAGRLPITVPRSVGQLPYNFPFKPGSHGRDEGQVSGPLYAFGHGLSYTRFEYSGLSVSPARIKPSGTVSVSVNVRNAGKLVGDEVVQLYVRDDYGSVTTFERSLRGFERIRLAPGQTRRVEFSLGPAELALFDANQHWTVEPGRFTLMVGGSSVDIRQSGSFSVVAADGSAPSEAPLGPEIVP